LTDQHADKMVGWSEADEALGLFRISLRAAHADHDVEQKSASTLLKTIAKKSEKQFAEKDRVGNSSRGSLGATYAISRIPHKNEPPRPNFRLDERATGIRQRAETGEHQGNRK